MYIVVGHPSPNFGGAQHASLTRILKLGLNGRDHEDVLKTPSTVSYYTSQREVPFWCKVWGYVTFCHVSAMILFNPFRINKISCKHNPHLTTTVK